MSGEYMDVLNQMLPYIGAASLTFLCCSFIYYACSVLRNEHAVDIQVVWYFYSFTLVLSSLIGIWAVNVEAINNKGEFVGESGEYINTLITASLDVNLSFAIIFCIFAIIILPQLLSYMLCGLFGVSSTPKYTSESINILMWGIIKTFVIVSGVTTTIPIFGAIFSWDSFKFNNIVGWLLLSIAFCLYSFFVLLVYRESAQVLVDIDRYVPGKLKDKALSVHNWFSRHVGD